MVPRRIIGLDILSSKLGEERHFSVIYAWPLRAFVIFETIRFRGFIENIESIL